MPKLKLDKVNIEKLKPDPTKDVLYWDTALKGFGVRLTKSGVCSFIVQGRVKGTERDVRITIGSYGVWQVDEARSVAKDYQKKFEQGIDPVEEKKQLALERVSLAEVATDYLAREKHKPTTAKWITFYVDKVFADWKNTPVLDITGAMILKRHSDITKHGLPGKKKPKGAPASANAAMVNLRALMNFARRQYRRADGSPLLLHLPTDVMYDHWNEEGDRGHRYIPFDKIGEVWNMLHSERAKVTHRDTLSAIDVTIMNMLCGGRFMEMGALTWDRVHLDDHTPERSFWHLIDRKQGKPIKLPLSRQAQALLRERKRMTNDPTAFVFPSRGKKGHIGDPRAALEKVSEVAGLHLSNHDLRRTFSNLGLQELRIEKFRVDLLIGHKPRADDVTASNYFDRSDLRWLYTEAQQMGDYIEQKGLIAAGANVIQLPQRA